MKKVKNPSDPKKEAPGTLYCDICKTFKSPNRQKAREHLMKKHGVSRNDAQREV